LGTDPDDPSSHPTPELLAGAVSERTNDDVVVTMAFMNNGVYDAYGVEVVAYAPNDSITIVDNTIGGSGRVRAGNSVVLGGRVKSPDLSGGWTGTAVPKAFGTYTSETDKTYTLTATASGNIGSSNLLFNWTDGSNNGQVQFGNGYLSPLPLAVGTEGLLVSMNSGSVVIGESFTIEARPPGDTIQYTINSEPYTPPVLVVSYNDPQGNHRFVTDVNLSDIDEALLPYSGQMIEDLGLKITTVAPFDEATDNTHHLIANSPHPEPIEDAHLFVENINTKTVDTVAETRHTI